MEQKGAQNNQSKNSNKDSNDKIKFIAWFSELNKNSGSVAGGKGANLGEMFNIGMPVPPGFAITAQAYTYFIEKAGIKNKIKEILSHIDYEDTKQLEDSTREIRKLIESSHIPKEMETEILDSYSNLDADELDLRQKGNALDIISKTSEPVFVAVRSSATAEDLADASFAGQQDTYLNVKGSKELIDKIKKCFASLFTARATYYRNKKGFEHDKVQLSVIIQKMIDSDKSGVIFSKDPSYKNDNIIIEAVYGLGEGIVSGQINPDNFIVSRDLEILETKIGNKKIAITRDSSGKKEIAKLKPEKALTKCLKDYEIKKLAEYAIKLEEHYQKPQDIEFAIEGDNIYIVQTRPITTMEKRTNLSEAKEVKGELILQGLAASPGIASGKIKIIEGLNDLSKIQKGDILVTKMTNPDMVVTMQKSAAIVTDEGGMTSHAAIVSREMGIPCVVGTNEATEKLKDGEIATVDGFKGRVYKGKVSENIQKEVLPIVQTKTKIKVIVDLPTYASRAAKSNVRDVGLTRIEGIIAESGKHPEYFLKRNKINEYEEIIYKGIYGIAKYFDNLWVRTSDIRTDEFQNLEGASKQIEANPMLGMHGIRYSLKNLPILKAELKALKKVAQKGKKIGILMPQVISVRELQETKKVIENMDFNQLQIGIMVETPAAVQIIEDLCKEGIDFISFGTNDLTQFTLAIDRGNEQVQDLFNELHPSILNQLSYVIKICKKNNVLTSICGQAGSNKEMVKFLVEQGIDSISVNADMAKEISEYIAQLEKEIEKETPEVEENDSAEEAHANPNVGAIVPGLKKIIHEKPKKELYDEMQNIQEQEFENIDKEIQEKQKSVEELNLEMDNENYIESNNAEELKDLWGNEEQEFEDKTKHKYYKSNEDLEDIKDKENQDNESLDDKEIFYKEAIPGSFTKEIPKEEKIEKNKIKKEYNKEKDDYTDNKSTQEDKLEKIAREIEEDEKEIEKMKKEHKQKEEDEMLDIF